MSFIECLNLSSSRKTPLAPLCQVHLDLSFHFTSENLSDEPRFPLHPEGSSLRIRPQGGHIKEALGRNHCRSDCPPQKSYYSVTN